MSFTNDVLKLDKFKYSNDLQNLNIPPIYSTFEVLKLDKFNIFNEKHEENINVILVTSDVLKFEISKDSNL